VKRVFISEDQDRRNKNDSKQYVTIKDWMLNTNCEKAELTPFSADSVLQLIVKRPHEKLGDISSATAIVGAPTFLNFLTNIINVLGIVPANIGTFIIDSFGVRKIHYGQFLLASPLYQSANTGFNFSPSRDMSEAVFWNPSAIANSKKANNISFLTNARNNAKLGGFVQLTEKLYLGAGGILTLQDERLDSSKYIQPSANPVFVNRVFVDTTVIDLKEYAAFISPVYKVSNRLSLSVTAKSLWQEFRNPLTVTPKSGGGGGPGPAAFTDTSVKRQHFDVDFSATYRISSTAQIGINLMNIAGTKIHSDLFVPRRKNFSYQNLRSLGVGLLYKWQRFNVGSDILLTEDGLYDATIGVNYVPFNNAIISGGFAVKQLSYSLSFRLKHFRIAYINDNNWMINEKRPGKSSILNGSIYGGFAFDFN
jgi:hypothetical protein